MSDSLNNTVNHAKKEIKDLVSKAKHDAFIANWIDTIKYGTATSAITVPILFAPSLKK